MPTQRYPFTEWLPDQPSVVNTLQDVHNVIPSTVGYLPFPTAVDYSQSASENINNVFALRTGGTDSIFAGSASKLYKLDSTDLSMDDKSKSGGYSGTSRWQFVQYGDTVLATNNSAKIQSWTGTAFADVSATAPVAEYITIIRDFVVVANVDGTPNKVQWSDLNDETNWTAGAASQSDFQLIADGGDIHGITGGEFGLVLLSKAIVRMSYIGSPFFFQFDVISRGLGCVEGNSVAQYGGITYFLSDDGFYACDGHTITPIGLDKVDKTFYKDVDLNKLDTISTAVDPIRKIVVWNYANVSGGRTLLIYNWLVKRWSKADTDVDYVAPIATTGLSLEGVAALYPNLDTLPTSLDDRLWSGGKFLFAGSRDDKIITFTGDNATANIIIGDIEQGYNSVMTLVRAQIQDGSVDVAVSSRRQLADNVLFGSTVSASNEGRCPVRSAGRYHRVSLTPTGSWTNMISADIDFTTQGDR